MIYHTTKEDMSWRKANKEYGLTRDEFVEGRPCKDKGKACKKICSRKKKYKCEAVCFKEECEGDDLQCISWKTKESWPSKKNKQTKAQIKGKLNCRFLLAPNGNTGRHCRLKNCGNKSGLVEVCSEYQGSDYREGSAYFTEDYRGKVNLEYCKLTDRCWKCHFKGNRGYDVLE